MARSIGDIEVVVAVGYSGGGVLMEIINANQQIRSELEDLASWMGDFFHGGTPLPKEAGMYRFVGKGFCTTDEYGVVDDSWYEGEFLNDFWIELSVQQPEAEQGNKVLGFNGEYVFECEFDDGLWCSIGGETMTHWMPLPNLPQK